MYDRRTVFLSGQFWRSPIWTAGLSCNERVQRRQRLGGMLNYYYRAAA